jgi:hypothetical protein
VQEDPRFLIRGQRAGEDDFDAIGGKDREAILKGLKEAKESFKTQ